MADPVASQLVLELHPEFAVPKKPFKRMNYSEAIVYLKENGISKDDGTFYEFGEVNSSFETRNIQAIYSSTL